MKDITTAEMEIVLCLVKSPEIDYNANNLAKVVGITSMGALKILKRLAAESVLKSKNVGKATIYSLNFKNPYARSYVQLMLSREALFALPLVKRWVTELKRIQNATIAILFGSVLEKQSPHDIDVLLITDQSHFSKLEQEIKELNAINVKKIHPLYQTEKDMIINIQKRDKPLLNAIKGVIIFGEEKFLEITYESRKE